MESITYWEDRYATGGDSGRGSRGAEAEEKGRLVSATVATFGIQSLLDIGCGDGQVASHYELTHCLYLGVDPARSAIKLARKRRPDLKFSGMAGHQLPMDAHLSMDVLQHLITEQDYSRHMALLFSARRYVLVYATDLDQAGEPHVLHRKWTPDVPPTWNQISMAPVTDRSSFYVYSR